MEERDGRQENGILLTQEEEASLTLLEPLFACHQELFFDLLPRVSRLTRLQREHQLPLPKGEHEGSVDGESGQAGDTRDSFGFGAGRQLRTSAHFLVSIQPLVFEALSRTEPHLYNRVWNALLKVIFHDLELAMSASLKQRDDQVEAATQKEKEAKRMLDCVLSKQVVDERQRQAEHRTVVNLLTIWLTKQSESAQEMGTPLSVILGHAESLLERIQDDRTQAALQSIVRQVERLNLLRQQFCDLDLVLGRELHAAALKVTEEESLTGNESPARTAGHGA